jgi:hypothetical protein
LGPQPKSNQDHRPILPALRNIEQACNLPACHSQTIERPARPNP